MGSIQQAMLAVSAAGGGAFDPLTLTGLDWWLDGDTATIDGIPEFDWPDSSSGSKPYGQNTVARIPTLVTINGHQAVRCQNGQAVIPDPNARTLGTANSLVYVGTKCSVAQYLLKGSNGEGGPSFISKFDPGSGVKDFEYFTASVSGERDTFAASVDSNLHILGVTHNDGGAVVGYFDDPSTPVFSFTSGGGSNQNWNARQFDVIGAFTPGSGTYDLTVAEILHGNALWSGTEITNLFTYLKAKWGIP